MTSVYLSDLLNQLLFVFLFALFFYFVFAFFILYLLFTFVYNEIMYLYWVVLFNVFFNSIH